MSRMLGNGRVLVLRGAGHREVSGLPDHCDSRPTSRQCCRFCPKRERDGLPADRSVAVPEFVLEVVVAALGCRRRGVVSAALLLGGAFGLAFQALAFGTDALVCLADGSIQELLQSRSRARLDLADDDPAASELHMAPSGCARGRWRFDQHHVEDLEEGEVRIRSHPNAQLPLLYLGRTPVDRVAHRLRP